MTNEEIADLIDKAHDELLHSGWCQGNFSNNDGTVCAVGALGLAVGVHPACGLLDSKVKTALEAVATTIRPNYGSASGVVMGWNDLPGRTEDEVFDAFRQTSKRLREQAQ